MHKGIHNIESCNKPVDSANKGNTYATEMGNWKFLADGGTPIFLSGMYIMEDFMSDIISLPKLLEKGCKVTHVNQKRIVVSLPMGKETLTFHQEEDGLFYMELKLIKSSEQVNEVAEISDDEGHQADWKEVAKQMKKADQKEDQKLETVKVNDAHEILGYSGITALHKQAKVFKWKLTGMMDQCDQCDACAKAKATAKGTSKEAKAKANIPGECLYWDFSGPYKQTKGANWYHGLLVDDNTGCCWSFFKPKKNKFAPDLEEMFAILESKGFPCKYLRLDNPGEAKEIKEVCKWHGIKLEYTAPDTPQFNAKVEWAFPAIRNMAYTFLMSSGMTDTEQMVHWAHAINDSTIMKNLQPHGEWLNAYEPFGELAPVHPENLVKFGAQGWMIIWQKIQEKWTPKAEEVIWVGYAADDSSDTYIVWKKSNGEYVLSCDIKWAEPQCYQKLTPEATTVDQRKDKDSNGTPFDSSGNQFGALDFDSNDSSESSFEANEATQVSSRVDRELWWLSGMSISSVAGRMCSSKQHVETVQNVGCGPKDPKGNKEAMNGPENEHWWKGRGV